MSDFFEKFNKVFENRVRLAVMSVLVVGRGVEFNDLKNTLNLTDGNLASHMATLEKSGYVVVTKKFVGKKPKTTYTATPEGRQAFTDHLSALERFLLATKQNPNSPAGSI